MTDTKKPTEEVLDAKALDTAANVFSSAAARFGNKHLDATEAIIRAYLATLTPITNPEAPAAPAGGPTQDGLEPCAHCRKPGLVLYKDRGGYAIICGGSPTCLASVGMYGGGEPFTEAQARAAWNRRPASFSTEPVSIAGNIELLQHQLDTFGPSPDGSVERDLAHAKELAAALVATPPAPTSAVDGEKLGRFGWHPAPAIDFELEVGDIEAEIYHHKVGFENGTPPLTELVARIERAMSFRVGAIETCVLAKNRLRELEKEAAALAAQAVPATMGGAGDLVDRLRDIKAHLRRLPPIEVNGKMINPVCDTIDEAIAALAGTPSLPSAETDGEPK